MPYQLFVEEAGNSYRNMYGASRSDYVARERYVAPKSPKHCQRRIKATERRLHAVGAVTALLWLLILCSVALMGWGIAGGILHLFSGVGPIIWSEIGGLVLLCAALAAWFGITQDLVPDVEKELADLEAEYDEAVAEKEAKAAADLAAVVESYRVKAQDAE